MPRDAAGALRARGLRVTPQRRAILDAFSDLPAEHLSADEVHARAAAAVPELSRGTVYATLAELTELGLLAALGSPEPVRYETNTSPHDHFRCRRCLRLFDVAIDAPGVDGFTRDGFLVEQVHVTAEGVCKECRDFARGLAAGAADVIAHRQLGPDTLGSVAAGRHETPYGPLLLAASADGIARIVFEEHADFGPLAARARSRRGPRAGRVRVGHLAGTLDAYLAGGREPADDEIDWALVPARSRTALEGTARIPYGGHRSYEHLCAGSLSAFDCGYALGSNPLPFVVPCHRVTSGDVVPESYVGGIERRRQLNRFESGRQYTRTRRTGR